MRTNVRNTRRWLLALTCAAALAGMMWSTRARADDQPASVPAAAAPAPVTAAPAPAAAAPTPPPTPDPSGANTGAAGDIPATQPGKPTQDEILSAIGHNKISINVVWTLITGFLVMFMQAGFAMVETGLTRAKNVAHTMAMNFMIYPLGMLGFWLCGFAFMFGGISDPNSFNMGGVGTLGGCAVLNHMCSFHLGSSQIDLIGWKGFCLGPSVYDVGVFTLFLFQMVFMDTTATIPTGSAAERWKYSAFVLYGCALGTILYPVYGCWVWGGGWLADLGQLAGLGHGTVDFAGSSVVHLQGGVLAVVAALFVGPRIGKYNKDGSANVIPAHNLPMAIIGTFILAFGWFGFNPGSTLAGTDLRIAVVATNTMLASATGALASMLWMWWVRSNKPDPSMMCNGMLAGLVAITAPCAFVTAPSACLIGLVSGILVVEAVFFIDRKLRIDDPVGAISVHGVNGAWGVISLGLLADGTYGQGWNGTHLIKAADGTLSHIADISKIPAGATEVGVTGLFYGNGGQLLAELAGVAACCIYLAIAGSIVFWVIEKIVGNRANAEAEIDGLDIPEMGAPGYVGVVMDKASETPVSR